MPMKLECMSLVCRMVKVFFPSAAAKTGPARIAAPNATEPIRKSRRDSASRDEPERPCGSFAPSFGGWFLSFMD